MTFVGQILMARLFILMNQIQKNRGLGFVNTLQNTINRKKMKRPTLEQCMMETAWTFSKRSVCCRLNVGCIISNREMTSIEAIGYNGKAKGENHEPDSEEPGKTGMVHAEENALIKADYKTKNKKVFVTHSPCLMCARKIINGDIDEVYFDKEYRDLTPLKKLVVSGVRVFRLFEDGKTEELKDQSWLNTWTWYKKNGNESCGNREFVERPVDGSAEVRSTKHEKPPEL